MGQDFTPHPIATIIAVPCPSDGVAAALRDAFDRAPEVPDDMMILLVQLDDQGEPRRSVAGGRR